MQVMKDLNLDNIKTSGTTYVEALNSIQAKNVTSDNITIISQMDSIEAGQITADNKAILQSGNKIIDIDGIITANALQLQANAGIGTDINPLTTDAAQLDAVNRYDGDINIVNSKDLILKDLNNDEKAIDNVGGGNIVSTGNIEVEQDVIQGKDFIISSGKYLIVDANIIHSGSGKIKLSSDEMIQKSGIIVSYDGSIKLVSFKNITQLSGGIKAANAEIFSGKDVTLTSGSNDFDILTANASKIAYTDINDIKINNVQAVFDIDIKADSIFDLDDDQLLDLASAFGNIKLTADKDISGISGKDNFLEIATTKGVYVSANDSINLLSESKLSLDNIKTVDGDINIKSHDEILAKSITSINGKINLNSLENDINIGHIKTDNDVILTAGGDIKDIANDSDADIIAGNGLIHLTAEGSISGSQDLDYLDFNDESNVWASSGAGIIKLYGEGNLTIQTASSDNGIVDIIAEKQLIAQNIKSNEVTLTAKEGSIIADNIVVNDKITLNAGDKIKDTDGSISSNKAILNASNGIGEQDNSLDLSVSNLDIMNASIGNIYISNIGELNLIDLDNDSKAIETSGSVSIETHSPVNIQNDIIFSGDLSITANNNDLGNDNVTINADISNKTVTAD